MKKILTFVGWFFLLWTAAWLFHNFLQNSFWPGLASSNQNLLYWSLAKVAIWIIFPACYAKKYLVADNLLGFLGLGQTKKAISYGLAASLIWVIISYLILRLQAGSLNFNFALDLIFLWVITGTPIAEEFTFRGVILSGLQEAGLKFWWANIVASLLFILVHILGWSFQESLATNLAVSMVGSILLLSLAVGWLRQKTGSVYAGMILHAFNNLFSALIT